jgi:hypothetical protein
LVTLGEGEFDEIIAYHSLCDIIEEHEEATLSPDDAIRTFTSIEGHQGPLKHGHPDHKGSSYNVLVVWEDGSKIYEPLDKMIKDGPITLAVYARKNNLLGVPGWKRLKNIASKVAKEHKTITNNLILMKGMRTKGPIFQFGIQVPRNVKEAYELDKRNGNTNWEDAMKAEVNSLFAFSTFNDHGKSPSLKDTRTLLFILFFQSSMICDTRLA